MNDEALELLIKQIADTIKASEEETDRKINAAIFVALNTEV